MNNKFIRSLLGILLIPAFCSNLQAQPRNGSFIMSPSFGLTGKKLGPQEDQQGIENKENELFSIGFNPRIGYFLSDHIAVGLVLKYGKKILKDNEGELNLFMAGPFARYYLNTWKITPFIEAEAGAGKYHESEASAIKNQSLVYFFSGGGGLEFFIIPSISFDLGVNFKRTLVWRDYPSGQGNSTYDNLGFRAGLSLHIKSEELSRK